MTREEAIKILKDYPNCTVGQLSKVPVKALFEFLETMPHWIPVEERLPGEGQVVLGVREGGTDVEMYKFMGFNESTDTFDWEWHPYYRAVVDDVTNWMEIVPPSKED